MKFSCKLKCKNEKGLIRELKFVTVGNKDFDFERVNQSEIFVQQTTERLNPYKLYIANGESFKVDRVKVGRNDQLFSALHSADCFVVNWDIINEGQQIFLYVTRVK